MLRVSLINYMKWRSWLIIKKVKVQKQMKMEKQTNQSQLYDKDICCIQSFCTTEWYYFERIHISCNPSMFLSSETQRRLEKQMKNKKWNKNHKLSDLFHFCSNFVFFDFWTDFEWFKKSKEASSQRNSLFQYIMIKWTS